MIEGFRTLTFDDDARESLRRGVDSLAKAVSVTMGPSGQNVIIEVPGFPPIVTKDGVTVARAIDFRDRNMNLGAQIVKEAASRTCDAAGDGHGDERVWADAVVWSETECGDGGGCGVVDSGGVVERESDGGGDGELRDRYEQCDGERGGCDGGERGVEVCAGGDADVDSAGDCGRCAAGVRGACDVEVEPGAGSAVEQCGELSHGVCAGQ